MTDTSIDKAQIQSLKDIYAGQRCFIMGNGPSIKHMNLNLLKNEVVWGFNKCFLLFDQIDWRPKFYTTNDIRLTRDISQKINELVEEQVDTTFIFPSQFKAENILKPSPRIIWINARNFIGEDLDSWTFSTDASSWVANAATVAISGLQLASFLGFNPIYLIGCDTSYTVPTSVTIEDSPENLISTQSDDPNHFSNDYFGKGDKWLLPNVDLMINQYEKSKKVLDVLGVNVFNATLGGNLETFPRIDFESLF